MNNPKLELSGFKVCLREFSEEHLHDKSYWNWLRDLQVIETINRIEYMMPMRFESIVAYVNKLWNSQTDAFFAIIEKSENRFVGTLRLANINWRLGSAEVGIMIGDRSAWNQGLAKDSVSVVCKYAFEKLGLRRLTGGTPEPNIAMRKCFERLGFKEEGRLRRHVPLGGKLVDRILYGLFSEEFKPWLP